MSSDLFERVVAASRLNQLVAPYTIRRLLIRSNVSPEELTPEGLEQALPRLEQGLAVYLKGDEHAQAMQSLRSLAQGG